jgi:Aspartyl/Asparaginyl beta-hydroxylase
MIPLKLDKPFIQLPLLFDTDRLVKEIEALGESCWMPHPQGFAGNSMLPLLAVNGDPDVEAFAGVMQPTPSLQRCMYLKQLLGSLGATIGRTRLMRLAGQAEVTRHADQGYYWRDRVRVHVPIVTQPTVRFECDDQNINMAAGECWIFDTWRKHSVQNDSVLSRIHLVCDTVGGDAFWDIVSQGRAHDAPKEHWNPRHIAFNPSSQIELPCEAVNVPVVMSPWEIEQHLSFLLEECQPHPQLALIRQRTRRFVQQWKGLWAQYGDAPDGRARFRAAMDTFVSDTRPMAQGIKLHNDMPWIQVLVVMISRVAVTSVGLPQPSHSTEVKV